MANMTPDQMVRARPPLTDCGISAHSPCVPFLPADFFRARVAGVADRHDPRVYPPDTDLDPGLTHHDTIAGPDAAHGREHGRRRHALHAPRSRGSDEEHEARGFRARVRGARQDGPGHAEGSDERLQEPEPSAAGLRPARRGAAQDRRQQARRRGQVQRGDREVHEGQEQPRRRSLARCENPAPIVPAEHVALLQQDQAVQQRHQRVHRGSQAGR